MSNYIDVLNQTAATSSASSSTATTEETSMGKEDFLTLLVAQLQNQDPLNPDDPTEFTAQLAQFSSLEQLFTLNESMESLVASSADSDRLSALSTLGKEVVYYGDDFEFEGNPVEVGYQLDGDATEVTLSLQHNGVTVATLKGVDLTEGNHFITWDGLTVEGDTASLGDYTVAVSAKAVDGESVAVVSLVKSEVTGIDMDEESGETLVTLAGSITFSEILGVYEPGTKTETSTTEEDEGNEQQTLDTLDTVAAVTESVTEIVE